MWVVKGGRISLDHEYELLNIMRRSNFEAEMPPVPLYHAIYPNDGIGRLCCDSAYYVHRHSQFGSS